MIPISEIISLILLAEKLFNSPKSGKEKLQYVVAQINLRYPNLIPEDIEKAVESLLVSDLIQKALKKVKTVKCYSCCGSK